MRLRSRIQKVERRLGVNQPRYFVIFPQGGPDGCLTEPPDDVREEDVVIRVTFGDDDEVENEDPDAIRMTWPEG